jgi:hypothetical protein
LPISFKYHWPEPTEADLYAIELSVDEALQIAAVATNFTIEPQSNLRRGITTPLGPISLAWLFACATLYEKELRLKKWRMAHNYPVCSQCGDVTPRLHGANLICPLCFATGMLEMPRGGYT